MTLAGPHRDDLRLTINGMDVQRFASQGQHKTLLVAMKIAEYSYMRGMLDETPMFLLDDAFSELDTGRVHRILEFAGGLGQVMITTTEGTVFGRSVTWGNHNRRFSVEHGTCRQEA
jgi:DNA replication and repair protein RecF